MAPYNRADASQWGERVESVTCFIFIFFGEQSLNERLDMAFYETADWGLILHISPWWDGSF